MTSVGQNAAMGASSPINPGFDAFERAKGLATGPRLKGSAIDMLLAEGRADDPVEAEAALWALSFASVPSRRLAGLCTALLAIAADRSLPSAVRAQAVEGIANHLQASTRNSLRRTARTRITGLAFDQSAEVRFWCAFALGIVGDLGSKHVLRRMRSDTSLVAGWWTVGQEASDALERLEGREPPTREAAQ